MKQAGTRLAIKRAVDVALAGSALLALSPLLAVVALGVRATMGTPVLFRQRRPGLHGVPFEIVKFRTMRDAVDADGRLLPDAERMTRFGTFLREMSIDELPELWNVLRGEMSLVGPRPLLMEYLARYTPEQARRHEVLPGLTGWAQTHGRNALGWEEKFALDVYYVDHFCLRLDAEILATTVWKVLAREGIAQGGHVTMPVFQGSAS